MKTTKKVRNLISMTISINKRFKLKKRRNKQKSTKNRKGLWKGNKMKFWNKGIRK